MFGPRAAQTKPAGDAPTHDVGSGTGWSASQWARVFASIHTCANVSTSVVYIYACACVYRRMDVDLRSTRANPIHVVSEFLASAVDSALPL